MEDTDKPSQRELRTFSSPNQRARDRLNLHKEEDQRLADHEVVKAIAIMRLKDHLAERCALDGVKDAATVCEHAGDGAERLAVSYLVINHEEKELPRSGF